MEGTVQTVRPEQNSDTRGGLGQFTPWSRDFRRWTKVTAGRKKDKPNTLQNMIDDLTVTRLTV